jgi:putative transposase
LKLNNYQMKLLEKHRHNYRFIYNKTIGILNDREVYDIPEFIKNTIFEKTSNSNYYSKYELRNLIVPEEVNCRTPWVLKSGSHIRAQAVFEAHKNWKTNIDLVKSGTKKFFNLKFKLKKAPTWTFNVEYANITTRKDAFGKTEFKLYEESGFIKTTESFEIKKDSSIHFDGKHYYILVPEDKPVKYSKANNFFVALDPGVRKFQTCYSPGPNEHVNVIGERASTKIYELLLMIDNAISTKNKKLEIRLRNRVKNLQKELHDKTSRFLCENYNVIYVPKLTKENDIIKKKNRKLRTKTVRNMVLLAHCKFIEKLKTKASEYFNVKVVIVTEEYTSQTCLRCHLKTKTSNELFKCNHCGFEIDRDILGSINILLKKWGLM